MKLEVIDTGATELRLALDGRLDAGGAEMVEAAFTAQVAGAPGHVLVDITRVSFAGSLGIRMLIAAGRVASRRGRQMVLVGPQAQVAEVFSVVALDDLIPVVADEAAALALLST